MLGNWFRCRAGCSFTEVVVQSDTSFALELIRSTSFAGYRRCASRASSSVAAKNAFHFAFGSGFNGSFDHKQGAAPNGWSGSASDVRVGTRTPYQIGCHSVLAVQHTYGTGCCTELKDETDVLGSTAAPPYGVFVRVGYQRFSGSIVWREHWSSDLR